MKRNIIIFLSLLTFSCVPSFYEDKPLTGIGDLNQFFQLKRTVVGAPTVKIGAMNPVSVSFIYQSTYVDNNELSNAAQHHCQKYNKSALEKSNKAAGHPYWKIVFECK